MSDPKLPVRASLEYLKKLAKDRLRDLRRADPQAKLAAALLAVAREHGFSSWRALKAELDDRRARDSALFFNACAKGNVGVMRNLLAKDPNLAHLHKMDRFGGTGLACRRPPRAHQRRAASARVRHRSKRARYRRQCQRFALCRRLWARRDRSRAARRGRRRAWRGRSASGGGHRLGGWLGLSRRYPLGSASVAAGARRSPSHFLGNRRWRPRADSRPRRTESGSPRSPHVAL